MPLIEECRYPKKSIPSSFVPAKRGHTRISLKIKVQKPLLSDFAGDILDAHDRVTTENVGKDSRNLLINTRECQVLCGGYTPDKDSHRVEDSIICIKGG